VANNLDATIQLYEEEKRSLETLIKQCLEDFEGPDFLLASYHQQALYKTDHVLRILYGFKDSRYDEKQRKISTIRALEKQLQEASAEYHKKGLEEWVQKEKSILEAMNATPANDAPVNEELNIDDVIKDLVSYRIKKFKLIFNRSENIFFQFSSSKKAIKVVFTGVKAHLKNNTLDHSEIKFLLGLGFVNINENRIELSIQNNDDAIDNIRIIISRIVFDSFGWIGSINDSYIDI
jgi:hypothetical protein